MRRSLAASEGSARSSRCLVRLCGALWFAVGLARPGGGIWYFGARHMGGVSAGTLSRLSLSRARAAALCG